MKISQIISAKRTFSNYLDSKMPPSVAYKILKLVRAADTEEVFYKNEIQKIIEQYGLRDENGNIVKTQDGNIRLQEEAIEECNTKLSELESLEVDSPDIRFTLEELSCVSMTVREMNAISAFISD